MHDLMSMRFLRLMIMIAQEMEMKSGKYETGNQKLGDNDQSEKCFQREHGTQVLIAHLTSIVHHVYRSAAPEF